MANPDYFDRSPVICPAGYNRKRDHGVAECLHDIRLQDKVDALLHGAGIYRETPNYPLPKSQNITRNQGMYTEVRAAISPPQPSAFQMLLGDLRETTYYSYWNKAVGKGRDPRPLLPPGVNNESRTFGKPPVAGEALYPIVLPEKNQVSVLRESQLGHELYRRSHQDYNPSERINRGYGKPFHDHLTFGAAPRTDSRGIGAKHCLRWVGQDFYSGGLAIENQLTDPADGNVLNSSSDQTEQCLADGTPKADAIAHREKMRRKMREEEGPAVVRSLSVIQGDFYDRREHQLGQASSPNANYLCVPKCHTYGKPPEKYRYTVADVFRRETLASKDKERLYACIAHLNAVRRRMRCRRESFPFEDIRDEMIFKDKQRTGWLPFAILVERLMDYEVPCDYAMVLDFMRRHGDAYLLCPEARDKRPPEQSGKQKEEDGFGKRLDIVDVVANYMSFIDLLDWRLPLPELDKIKDMPKEMLRYETSYGAANEDYKTDIHQYLKSAGAPTVRVDKEQPVIPKGGCAADRENLGDETTAGVLIYPSIMSRYGLDHRDFMLPRTPEEIRGIFERTGVEFPDDNTFDAIFAEASRQDCDKEVGTTCCVETFRNQLHKLAHAYYNTTK